ncbi:GNAT family N-acetyltransferase [Leucobacter luti]|uniref:GNAT family N-acetyltransferase n=1 Tax=Leucobacter luti TaxID=340320 RepID=UPI003D05F8BE
MRIPLTRLTLRELRQEDFPALCAIMQDPEAMHAYEGAFDDGMVREWLGRMIRGQEQDGYSLWAVMLTETGELIGQCGITCQPVGSAEVLEVGYLFNRAHWGHGYAGEAAAACVEFAFARLGAERVWAIIRDTNLASMNVAIRLGMTVRERIIKHYRGIDMPHLAFAVDRDVWRART